MVCTRKRAAVMSLNYTVRYCAITVSDVISFMDWMPFYKVKEFRSASAAEESNRMSYDEENIEEAVRLIREADILIVGGTSLGVYPAAGLIDYYRGHKLVLINKSETPYDNRADLLIHDALGEVFSKIG